jgi:hypothetical protein
MITTNSIYLIHKDWHGNCHFNDNKIIRSDYENEFGYYNLDKNNIFHNILEISWEKWDKEIFYSSENDNEYILESLYNEKYKNIIIFDKTEYYYVLLNKSNNIYKNKNKNIYGKYKIYEQSIILINYEKNNEKNNEKKYEKNNEHKIKEYKLINNNYLVSIYYLLYDTYFELIIFNKKYLFNKINNLYYNINDINISGNYQIIDNKISNNINIIEPKCIKIENRILFSNISLCKNR